MRRSKQQRLDARESDLMAPSAWHSPAVLLKAQGVKVAFFDVDGVLTDGGLYFSASGETLKRFNALDGHGLKLLQRADIVPAIITGRDSRPLRSRLRALGVVHAYFGVEDKVAAALMTLRTLGLQWNQAAMMGDDWPDIRLMRSCAFAATVPNAHDEVIAIADFVSRKRGGEGGVREFCDLMLLANGKYARQLEGAVS